MEGGAGRTCRKPLDIESLIAGFRDSAPHSSAMQDSRTLREMQGFACPETGKASMRGNASIGRWVSPRSQLRGGY